MDEQALIQRCQAGDVEAFEELLGRYEGLVFNLVHRYFGGQAEAPDVAQEAMLKIFRRIGDFHGRSSFKTWVYRVVTNVCLDALRQRRTHPVSLDELAEAEKPVQLPAPGRGPDEMLEQSELREILFGILAAMDVDQRMVIVLRDVEGLAYEEIAEILDCNLGTVKSRLSRAREAMRRRFLNNPRSSGWVERRKRA